MVANQEEADILTAIIKKRRSHREFASRPVPEDHIVKIVEAGLWAPSSCNMQLFGLIRVTDPAIRERLVSEAKSHGTVRTAPVVFVATYEKELSQGYHSNIQSGAAALENMMLMATSLGLGCFWAATVGKEKIVRRILNIPPRREILALALFGWPKEDLIAPRRRDPSEIVHNNQYDPSLAIPLKPKPDDWPLEALLTFQELRLRSGARYIPYLEEEFENVIRVIKQEIQEKPASWFDFLPGTGAYTASLAKSYPDTIFSIADIAEQVLQFTKHRIGKNLPSAIYHFNGLKPRSEQVFTCLFRLEAYPQYLHKKIITDLAQAIPRGGLLVLGLTNRRSYYWPLYLLKAARLSEFRFPTMTPNVIAPFYPVLPETIITEAEKESLKLIKRRTLFLVPTAEELSTFYNPARTGFRRWFLKSLESLSLCILPKRIHEHFAKIQLLFFETV